VFAFSIYLFYSEKPTKTVYVIQVHTNIDWCKKIQKENHYYAGNDLSLFIYPDEKFLQIGSVFTKREFEIIKLIQLGCSTEQIAEKLFVSTRCTTLLSIIISKTNTRICNSLVASLFKSRYCSLTVFKTTKEIAITSFFYLVKKIYSLTSVQINTH
jgi:DNA-binding CsgD family transcriptional regulator